MDIKDQIKQLVDGMALATSAISREIAGDKLATCNLLLILIGIKLRFYI